MFDYLIVGAGLAGATLAERLVTQLHKKVLVIDKRTHIGGNTFDINSPYLEHYINDIKIDVLLL